MIIKIMCNSYVVMRQRTNLLSFCNIWDVPTLEKWCFFHLNIFFCMFLHLFCDFLGLFKAFSCTKFSKVKIWPLSSVPASNAKSHSHRPSPSQLPHYAHCQNSHWNGSEIYVLVSQYLQFTLWPKVYNSQHTDGHCNF